MDISTIYIGSDHRGFELKQHIIKFIKSLDIEVIDVGNTVYNANDDYPDYAVEVARQVASYVDSLGIVVCGTGVGVSIVTNKIPGIRSAVLSAIETVAIARAHNHINVLALSSNLEIDQIPSIVETFITTEPSLEERHIRRLAKITELENNQL
jgi:ribose 5-phosphate isomerase B